VDIPLGIQQARITWLYLKLCTSESGAFTKSPLSCNNFKLALSYYAAFDATAKIDFTRVIIVRRKADRKLLFGFSGCRNLTVRIAVSS